MAEEQHSTSPNDNQLMFGLNPLASPSISPPNPLVGNTSALTLSSAIPPEALQKELEQWTNVNFTNFDHSGTDPKELRWTLPPELDIEHGLFSSDRISISDVNKQSPDQMVANASQNNLQQRSYEQLSSLLPQTFSLQGFQRPDAQPHHLNDLSQFQSRSQAGDDDDQQSEDSDDEEELPPAKRHATTSSSGKKPVPQSVASSSSQDNKGTPKVAGNDKRRRNTEASARFRLRKKEKEAALEASAKTLQGRVDELEKEVESLRTENGWLRGLILEKTTGGGGGGSGNNKTSTSNRVGNSSGPKSSKKRSRKGRDD